VGDGRDTKANSNSKSSGSRGDAIRAMALLCRACMDRVTGGAQRPSTNGPQSRLLCGGWKEGGAAQSVAAGRKHRGNEGRNMGMRLSGA
jgi:hypothetical protein